MVMGITRTAVSAWRSAASGVSQRTMVMPLYSDRGMTLPVMSAAMRRAAAIRLSGRVNLFGMSLRYQGGEANASPKRRGVAIDRRCS